MPLPETWSTFSAPCSSTSSASKDSGGFCAEREAERPPTKGRRSKFAGFGSDAASALSKQTVFSGGYRRTCGEPSAGAGVGEVGLGQRTAGVLPMLVSASHENSRANYPNLAGKRILIVDDEAVISVDYRYQLLDVGASPAGFLVSSPAAAVHV